MSPFLLVLAGAETEGPDTLNTWRCWESCLGNVRVRMPQVGAEGVSAWLMCAAVVRAAMRWRLACCGGTGKPHMARAIVAWPPEAVQGPGVACIGCCAGVVGAGVGGSRPGAAGGHPEREGAAQG